MVPELIRKYLWLIRTITAAGRRGVSLEELQDKWEKTFFTPYPRRTFNNHREAIMDIFGVEIKCDRSTNRYYFPFEGSVMDSDSSLNWMVNTFTVGNLLSLSKERLSGRVSVDDIPSGHKWLTTLIDAMLQGRETRISYRKYTGSTAEDLTVRPYALKEFLRRWYVVGYCVERKALRVYGLDRILSLEILDGGFRLPRDFDVDELFSCSFGIFLPEKGVSPVGIVFRAGPTESGYLRDLPIHPSQRILYADPERGGYYFKIFVVPDRNLVMELCKHGDRIEIVSPGKIRDAVAEEHRKALALYENKDKTI